jgi:hypothetical protein
MARSIQPKPPTAARRARKATRKAASTCGERKLAKARTQSSRVSRPSERPVIETAAAVRGSSSMTVLRASIRTKGIPA